MIDVKAQLARLGTHLDDTVPGIDDDELARRIAVLEMAAYKPRPKPRGAVIAVAAAIVVLVLVGAVPLILDLMATDDAPPATDLPPEPTAVSSAPTAAPTAPPATSGPPVATTAPADSVAPIFDYAEVGEYAGTLETEMGNLEFFTLRYVPYQWIEDGFPGPDHPKPDHDFRTIWANAHSGLEIFDADGGFLGLGSTAGPAEPRIMTGYLGDLFRARGVGTQAEFEKAFHGDPDLDPESFVYEYWTHGTWCCTTPDDDWFRFVPAEAWFSDDGIDWELMAAEPFGPETVMLSQPRSVAEHNGTWMVLGWTGVSDPADLVAFPGLTVRPERSRGPGFAHPAMWTSTDLKTWTQVPFDFGAAGWDTTLESVVASEAGWLVVGKRESHETPRVYSSVVWLSTDGVDWTELPIEELVGLPHCGPFDRAETCLHTFGAEFVPGGIGFYASHRSPTGWGWTLWVGLWED